MRDIDYPKKDEQLRAASFAVSMVATVLFALQVTDRISLPVLVILPFWLAYPAARLHVTRERTAKLDYAYLLIGFGGLAGILAFSSPYPVGYVDVHNHLLAIQSSVVNGNIQFSEEASTSFVGLYVLTTIVSDLTRLAVPQVARVFPLVTFSLTITAFYHATWRYLLPRREAFFAALVFGTNWGVFRFAIEFRTLSLALLFMILLLMVCFRWFESGEQSKPMDGVFLLFTAGLATVHLTTYIFYFILVAAVVLTLRIHRQQLQGWHLVITAAAPILYMRYIAGSLSDVFSYISRQIATELLATSPSAATVASGSGQGLVGLTYGFTMFVAQWTVRLAFIISFVTLFIFWLQNHNKYGTFMMISSSTIGLILLFVTITGFLLNPSRVLTFFALPYALVYAFVFLIAHNATTPDTDSSADTSEASVSMTPDGGLKRKVQVPQVSLNRLQSQKCRRALSIVAIALVAVMLVTTMMRFPVGSVGPTQPVRGQSAVDDQAHMYLGESDLDLRGYLGDAGGTRDTVWAHYPTPGEERVMGTFHQYGLPREGASTENCKCQFIIKGGGSDGPTGATQKNVTSRESLLYDNGDDRVFYTRWNAT